MAYLDAAVVHEATPVICNLGDVLSSAQLGNLLANGLSGSLQDKNMF